MFILDEGKNLLESNSVYELENAESVICDSFKKSPWVTPTKLHESLTVTKTVEREILMERDIPDTTENDIVLR